MKGALKDKRRAIESGVFRRCSNASDTAFNVWWRNGVRECVMAREDLHIRKFGEDPNFIAPAYEMDLSTIIEEDREEKRLDLIMEERAKRKAIDDAKKDEEHLKLTVKIEMAWGDFRCIKKEIARLHQERHLIFCDDDDCPDCTNTVEDWVYHLFCD